MSELYEYIEDDSLIIFDIDNTLITPPQELGNDQWFRYQTKKYEKQGLTHEAAMGKTLTEWTAIQHITDVALVEPDIALIIRDLQNKGYDVIGLTTRDLDISTRTYNQLLSVDIDLTKTAPVKQEIFFLLERPVLFRYGILFTANTDKGLALKKLLAAAKYDAKSVVFINDKKNHLEPVEKFCKDEDIPFIGLRYGYHDDRVESFNPTIAEIQFAHFGQKLLTDDHAQKLIVNQAIK